MSKGSPCFDSEATTVFGYAYPLRIATTIRVGEIRKLASLVLAARSDDSRGETQNDA